MPEGITEDQLERAQKAGWSLGYLLPPEMGGLPRLFRGRVCLWALHGDRYRKDGSRPGGQHWIAADYTPTSEEESGYRWLGHREYDNFEDALEMENQMLTTSTT